MQIDGSVGSQGRSLAGIVSGVLYSGRTDVYVANSGSVRLFFADETSSSDIIINHLKEKPEYVRNTYTDCLCLRYHVKNGLTFRELKILSDWQGLFAPRLMSKATLARICVPGAPSLVY